MKITAVAAQVRNPDRVNVSIDGKYRLSLDISQVVSLGVKIGAELSEEELSTLETESQFGKLYAHALEYALSRPHSVREMRDYLRRKTLARKYKSRRTGEIKEAPGVSESVAVRVLDRLQEKCYVDDELFARWWIENRNLAKGASRRKLTSELRVKGVPSAIIEQVLGESSRNDADELAKIIAKKRAKYADAQKFMQYLARQGFGYDDIKSALEHDAENSL